MGDETNSKDTNSNDTEAIPEWKRKIDNYDRAQRRNKQNRFERSNVVSLSRLGFNSTDEVTVAVLGRLSGKVVKHQAEI